MKLSFLPFFAAATIEALKAHPIVNSSINLEEKTVTYHDAVHLGIAVDSERGLAVPVIHDAGDLNLAGIARKIADLAERTRSNKISPDELGGGTFTLTNTGSRGALFDTPIINQPQVGILGTGTVVKRAVVVDDPNLGETIAIRSMVYLALSYDHRIVDGADAARFLGTRQGTARGRDVRTRARAGITGAVKVVLAGASGLIGEQLHDAAARRPVTTSPPSCAGRPRRATERAVASRSGTNSTPEHRHRGRRGHLPLGRGRRRSPLDRRLQAHDRRQPRRLGRHDRPHPGRPARLPHDAAVRVRRRLLRRHRRPADHRGRSAG